MTGTVPPTQHGFHPRVQHYKYQDSHPAFTMY